jgi:dolichol kinase
MYLYIQLVILGSLICMVGDVCFPSTDASPQVDDNICVCVCVCVCVNIYTYHTYE